MITQINDRKLEELLLDSNIPLCITFFEYDSNTCKNLMPELHEAAKQLNDIMRFYTVNTTENERATRELKVNSVPTMIIYREGNEIARYDGVHRAEALVKQFTSDIKED